MKAYDTVTSALNDLRSRGFVNDFNLQFDCIDCGENEKIRPENFEVVETYRFEGNTDPADEAIVYAIETKDGRKGVLVSGYGAYSEDVSEDMVRKLRVHRAG